MALYWRSPTPMRNVGSGKDRRQRLGLMAVMPLNRPKSRTSDACNRRPLMPNNRRLFNGGQYLAVYLEVPSCDDLWMKALPRANLGLSRHFRSGCTVDQRPLDSLGHAVRLQWVAEEARI